MILNIPLRSKQERIEPTRCEVDCVVEIPYDEFIRFRDNPLTDQDFIKEHLDELQPKDYSTASCLPLSTDLLRKAIMQQVKAKEKQEDQEQSPNEKQALHNMHIGRIPCRRIEANHNAQT